MKPYQRRLEIFGLYINMSARKQLRVLKKLECESHAVLVGTAARTLKAEGEDVRRWWSALFKALPASVRARAPWSTVKLPEVDLKLVSWN